MKTANLDRLLDPDFFLSYDHRLVALAILEITVIPWNQDAGLTVQFLSSIPQSPQELQLALKQYSDLTFTAVESVILEFTFQVQNRIAMCTCELHSRGKIVISDAMCADTVLKHIHRWGLYGEGLHEPNS